MTLLALVLLAGVYVRALRLRPWRVFIGAGAEIFDQHVPAAWSAMLAMALVGIASILFLLMRDYRYDRFAARFC